MTLARAGLALLATLVSAATASADPVGEGIGVYGRFDHDLALSAGAGGGARVGAPEGAQGLATGELRVLYLHTAGLALGATLAPGQSRPLSASLAVDLRPIFLISVFENAFVGDSFVDLVRDAIGIEAGVATDGERPAFLVGLGTELPLARDRDTGLYLRVGARLLFARTRWVGGAGAGTTVELAACLQAHGGVSAGLL